MPASPQEGHTKTSVVNLAACGSTNVEALRLGMDGHDGPVWVTAQSQTSGKGRDGRAWISEPGNLYASLLMTYTACFPAMSQLSLVCGLAVHDAIRAAAPDAGLDLALKWPNDVLLARAKVAGILIETTTRPADHRFLLVAGFGVNLNAHPERIDQKATNLAEYGVVTTPVDALNRLDAALQRWLKAWDCGNGYGDVREAWLSASRQRGRQVTARNGDTTLTGECVGLDDDGALLIRDEHGRTQKITCGDVTNAT